jgi:hypothetical protein
MDKIMSEQKKPLPRGRPSKYDPKYCETVIELMKEGKSLSEVCAAIGIGRNRMMHWTEEHKEFRDSIDTGKALAQAWWEEVARKVATGDHGDHEHLKKAHPGLIMFIMSRRYQDYFNKTTTMVTKEGQDGKTTVVFETQLSNGVVRQDTKNEIGNGAIQTIDAMVSEVMDEVCRDN